MGGWSGERDVSIQTGTAVATALGDAGYDVVPIVVPGERSASDPSRGADAADVLRCIRRADVDVVFVALHGRMGEDGCLQGLLELEKIPYTGSGVLASALAMDKVKAKELFLLHNIPTPPFYTVPATADLADVESIHQHFGFPVIVKPRAEGSSLALTKATSHSELARALTRVFEFDDWALVERYVAGAEVTVGILNGRVLGAIEVCPAGELYDYHAKYDSGDTRYFMPARMSPARYKGVLNLGARAAEVLDTRGAARVDLLVTPGENEYVLEVNTLPGMTETSLLPKIAAHAGYDFPSLCDAIVQSADLHTPMRARWDDADAGSRRSGIVPAPGVFLEASDTDLAKTG
ncbi:MAG: D-alanine--D-alanine ligase [Deltaproteobacteria bacterium]|jgi:D-alanine-D-alanine ligase|nr:D-alanine--D-alanine ligase [Deltaproteobacteria bacterium]MBW2530843.1 D-alanine--D-alanine ligase [Deltaproteobacteria bacterium]